jgi:hypothetical protein
MGCDPDPTVSSQLCPHPQALTLHRRWQHRSILEHVIGYGSLWANSNRIVCGLRCCCVQVHVTRRRAGCQIKTNMLAAGMEGTSHNDQHFSTSYTSQYSSTSYTGRQSSASYHKQHIDTWYSDQYFSTTYNEQYISTSSRGLYSYISYHDQCISTTYIDQYFSTSYSGQYSFPSYNGKYTSN